MKQSEPDAKENNQYELLENQLKSTRKELEEVKKLYNNSKNSK